MADATAERADLIRSMLVLAIALVAGILVAWIIGGLFGFGSAPGLIFGAVTFLILPYLVPGGAKVDLHASGPVDPQPVAYAPAAPIHAPTAPAEPARFVEMPTSEGPATNAISERVREAARAAGEAARALAGDGDGGASARPAALSGPRDGVGDDLKRLRGVGPKFEVVLHDLGIWHFDQIAAWGSDEVAWIDSNLDGFHCRVTRDGGVAQAEELAEHGETPHAQEKIERDTTE